MNKDKFIGEFFDNDTKMAVQTRTCETSDTDTEPIDVCACGDSKRYLKEIRPDEEQCEWFERMD